MTSRKLLIVTTAYPYGHGESFLAPELEFTPRYVGDIELVPCSYKINLEPRNVRQTVNLDYATKRWGIFRNVHLVSSFAAALVKYNWVADAVYILKHKHRIENIKEFARSLYRANLFEQFLRALLEKRKEEIDLVYFYWMMPEIMGAIALRQSLNLNFKIIARAHGGDLYEELRAGEYCGLRTGIVSGVDAIYCISEHGKSYLDSKFPSLTNTFKTARLGIIDPGHLNVQSGGDELSIVSCSFVVDIKRVHLIVEAIDYLLNDDPSLNIKWTHIGDGKLFDEIRAYASEKLKGRAEIVFKGYLAQDQVMDVYRNEKFDVFINVSLCEGIPVSLMEASSVGIPMIATDVGGSGEIVNSKNGVLISVNSDIRTIASALIRFKDKFSSLEYRKNARLCWEAKFNAETNHNAFGRELVNVMDTAPGIESDALHSPAVKPYG